MLSHCNMKPGQTLYQLTWEDNGIHAHEVPPTEETQAEKEEREALQTLQALSGDYRCLYCDDRLYNWIYEHGTVCFSCRHTFLCPVCGVFAYKANAMYAKREQCGHLLTPLEDWISSFILQAPVVPKSNYYPQWSSEQIYQAYGPELAVYVRHLFHYDLRTFDFCRFQDLVFRLYIQPDFRVCIQNYEFDFCRDVTGGLRRVRGFYDALAAGTDRLRALQPVRMVRDWTS